MATWVAHIRVAEKLLEKLKVDEEMFLAGNTGPDSGVPNENYSEYTPGKLITHWLDESLVTKYPMKINAEKFFDQYIKDKELDIKEKAFFIGYYTHLLTDIEWSKMITKIKNENEEYRDRFPVDMTFVHKVKKDWYGIDYKYLKENENCIFNRVYKDIKEIPDYLDYFPKGALIKQKEHIVNYYSENNESLFNKEFKYLTEDMMEQFVEETSRVILDILIEKGIIKSY